jgi:hypothetical protein
VPGLLLIARWRVHRCQPAVRCAPEALPALARPGGWRRSSWAGGTIHTLSVGRFMDRQSKREILILAIGTLVVEVPIAAIAVIAILAH